MKSVTLVGQQFTKRAGRVKLPYLDQVAGYYLFGGSAAQSLPNLAYGASQNLSAIASPTYGAGYAVIDGTNGFETGLLLDTPFTHIVVMTITTANSALAMLSRGAGNGDNFTDMLRFSTQTATLDGWPDGSLNQSLNSLPTSGYMMCAQSWGGTGSRHTIYALQGTVLGYATSSVNITESNPPTHTLKFGTGYTAFSPSMRVAAGVLAAKVLSAQQIYDIGIYLRALLATRGITMV
jgi:hypothetical protein